MREVRSGLALGAALLLLLAAMAIKDALIFLPSPPSTPSSAGFDANRAAARLQRVLGDERPHPVDSAGGDAVRARLIAEMRAAGLQPRASDEMACNGFARARTVACARVRNLVASIGPRAGRHVLLATHHDSTFAGPGSADAGIGVATLLETAAALRGRELRRPVSFLFNDGEEMGLIGARAFVARDPLARRVDSLLNFEARGVTGPAAMFETSRPNGRAIGHFARAADRPFANSLSTDLYGLIPNATDVVVYQERPWTILNFAIIGNETRYHSAGDNLAALDRRSLQHMGDQALGLTLDLANGEPVPATGERIYTDLLGLQLVTFPLLFGSILLGILLFFFVVEAWRRSALGRPLIAVAAAMAGSGALAWLGQAVLGLIRSGDYWRGYPIVTEIAVYASAIAAGLLALVLIARDADRTRLRASWWLLFLLGGLAIVLVAPGGSIYFLLPPLAAALGMALERRLRGTERIGAILAILLLFLTFAPPLAMFEELLNNGPHWLFAPIGAAILLPALIELRPLIARVPRIFVLAAAGDLLLLPWAAVAFTPAYSDDRQQMFTFEYFWDAEARRGLWAVNNDGAPVPYDAPWQRGEVPYTLRPRWTIPGPAIPVPAPALELVAQQQVPGGRHVRLRLRSHGGESVTLIAPADAALRSAGIGAYHQRFGEGRPTDRYIFRCVGRSCDGALVDLVIGRTEPVEFLLGSSRSGLPPQAAPLLRARPARARPQYTPDSTLVVRRIRL
jgi:hypothetical protein